MTVAICTRDRTEDLAICLDSLDRVDYEDFEIVVVDNAPASDATRLLVERRGGRVRYVREPRPGLDWARNRAIAEATGDVVAFADDDVTVDPGWLRALAAAFGTDEAVAAVTGLVLPAELQTEAQVLFERYRSFGSWVHTPPGRARGHRAAGESLRRRRRLRHRRQHGLPPLAVRLASAPSIRRSTSARRRAVEVTWICSSGC